MAFIMLHEFFAPDAIDATNRKVTKALNFKSAGRKKDAYLMKFYVSREKSKARMAMGSGFPDDIVSTFCAQKMTKMTNHWR